MDPKCEIPLAVIACGLLGAAAMPVGAQQASSTEPTIVGTWKLVSFQSIADGEPPRDAFGANPKGYFIATREGRVIGLITSSSRKAGTDDAERAALHKSMISFSGKYRVEGDLYIATVDLSWNEAWNGTEQRRHFRFEDGKLLIDTVRQQSAGKMAIGRLVWERDK